MRTKLRSSSLGFLLPGIIVFFILACSSGNILTTATPVATQTAYPTYTLYPTYTRYMAPTAILPFSETFFEEFSGNSSCFGSYSDPNASMQQENGIFLINLYGQNQHYLSICENHAFSDFIYEVVLEVPEYATGEYYYGVVFRSTGYQYYSFTVDSISGENTAYCIQYIQGEQIFPLSGSSQVIGNCWVQMPPNVYDPNSNTFRVSAIGDTIQASINGEILATIRETTLVAGNIGIMLGTFDREGLEVVIDNVRVSEP